MADGDSGMIDTLLQEREVLRSENAKQNVEHKKIVERLRAELDDTIRKSSEENVTLRKQLEDSNKSNQDLIRELGVQTQNQLQARNSLDDVERRYNVLNTQKSNVVVLLGTAEKTIAALRDELTKEKDRSHDLCAQLGQSEVQFRSQHSELQILKITEKSLRKEVEEKQSALSATHSQLREKDREITRARQEGDVRVKEIDNECVSLREQAHLERRNVVILQEQLRREQETVSSWQARSEELSALKQRHQQQIRSLDETHQKLVSALKETIASLKERIDYLESEQKIRVESTVDYEEKYQESLEESQARIEELNLLLEDKTLQFAQTQKEITHLKGLLSAIRLDSSQPIPANLRNLFQTGHFSVPELYHQYCLVVEKCDEAQAKVQSLQNYVSQRDEEYKGYSIEKKNFEESIVRWQNSLADAESKSNTHENINRNLQRTNDELRKSLKFLERENKKLNAEARILQANLARALQTENEFDEELDNEDPAKNDAMTYRNTAELIEINLSLRETIETLSLENGTLKRRLEEAEKSKESFVESAEAIRKMNEDKSLLDRRMVELAREIQFYRMSHDDVLLKTFLQELAKNEDMVENVQSVARDERAVWSLISAYNGTQISDHFSSLKQQADLYKTQSDDWKNQCAQLQTKLEQLSANAQGEIQNGLEERGRLSGEINGLKQQLSDVRLQLKLKSDEVEKHFSSVCELHEKLSAAQQENSTNVQILDSERVRQSFAEEQLQNLKLEISSLKNQLDSFREQNGVLQQSIRGQSDRILQLQMLETRLHRDIQDAREAPSHQIHFDSVVSREELHLEQQKHKVTLQALADAKKQLDELAHSTANQTTATGSSSSGGSRINPEITMSMLRQSSIQQEELSQKITDLQAQLEKSRSEIEAKTGEISQLKAESSKKAKEISSDNCSLMKDLKLVKEERERQQNMERELRLSLDLFKTENARLEESLRAQRTELDSLTSCHAAELKSHHAVVSQLEEIRKELELVKQNLAISKRREADAIKALEDLRRSAEDLERNLREEIRLLEQERENTRNWKRTVYERVRPPTSGAGSAADLPDDVQDLNILVEFQKTEIEKISQLLQLAKDQGFVSSARIKSLQEQVKSLELDLQSALQRQRSTSITSSWSETHAQQKAILNDSLELNARLNSELIEARAKIDELQASLKTVEQSVEPLNIQIRDLERDKIRLEQESKTVRGELESWNSRFGVHQQKTEIESLKKTINDLEKKITDINAANIEKLESAKKKMQNKMNEIIQGKEEKLESAHKAAISSKDAEITALRTQLVSCTSLLEKATAEINASKKDVENLQKSLVVMETSKANSNEEIATLREVIRELKGRDGHQANVSFVPILQRTTEDRDDLSVQLVTSVQPQPRPSPIEKPVSLLRSTAVVTPQAQSSAPTSAHRQASAPVRGISQTPVVAVAPQAQASDQPEAIPSMDLGEGPSGTSAPGMAAPAPAVTRRRQADGEAGASPAERKRPRIAPAVHPLSKQIQLRPPSPTSSDVTSSTSAPSTLTLGQPSPSTSSGSNVSTVQRSRTRGSTEEQPAGVQSQSEEAVTSEDTAATTEERAVDSSADELTQPNENSETGATGMEIEDTFENEVTTEGHIEEGMDADESGQPTEEQTGSGQMEELDEIIDEYGEVAASSEAETADVNEARNPDGSDGAPLQSATISADGASGEVTEAEDTPSPQCNISQEASLDLVSREADFQMSVEKDLPFVASQSEVKLDFLVCADDLVEEGELFDLESYTGEESSQGAEHEMENSSVVQATPGPPASSAQVSTNPTVAQRPAPIGDLAKKAQLNKRAATSAASWAAVPATSTEARAGSPQRASTRKPISPPRGSTSGESSTAPAPRVGLNSIRSALYPTSARGRVGRGTGGRGLQRGGRQKFQ